MIYIRAVHMVGSVGHEHIASVCWLNGDSGISKRITTDAMINFIDAPNVVKVGGSDGPVAVGVVRPPGRKPYLRTHADGKWNDNLLALPRF